MMLGSVYLRIAGFAILAAVLMASGYKMGARTWETKYRAELAAQWQQKARGEEAARHVLEQQIADARSTTENNSTVISRLQNANSQIIADRDNVGALARRLLAGQVRSCPGGRGLSETPSQSGTAGAGPAPEDGRFAGLFADAVTEARLNAAQLNALADQIRPQL